MNRGVCTLPLLFFTLSPPQTKSKKQKQSHHRHARTTEYNVREKSPRPSPPLASKQASPRPHVPTHPSSSLLFQTQKACIPNSKTHAPLLSSLFPLSYSPYSTVTDFAKFLGISTFNPSATANQYAINCSGITFSRPCRQSTVFGISIFSHLSSRNSSSSGLQMTIGLPERAMTA